MDRQERKELLERVFGGLSDRSDIRRINTYYESGGGIQLTLTHEIYARCCLVGSITLTISISWDELCDEDTHLDSLIDKRWGEACEEEMKKRGAKTRRALYD